MPLKTKSACKSPQIEVLAQTRRRANLRHLVTLLQKDRLLSLDLVGKIIGGIDSKSLAGLLREEPISDGIARDIEWHANRPRGWLDAEWDGPLDD